MNLATGSEQRKANEAAFAPVRWMRVSAVCRRLDVKKRVVYAWIEQGIFSDDALMRLPRSGQWRIRESAVVALERLSRSDVA
jgi:predicted site-specific integrase-resolvase